MKKLLFTCIFCSLFQFVFCQSHEISIKLLALSKSSYKQSPIQGSTLYYSTKSTPAVNLILGYTLSKVKKYDLNLSYGIFKNTSSYTRNEQFRKETYKQSAIWQHISLSYGKRFYYNKYLIITSIGIPFEFISSDKQTINIDRFDPSNNLVGTTYNVHKKAPAYSFGMFLNQGVYYSLISNLYIGFDIRIGISVDKLLGPDISNTTDTYNGVITITNQALNLNITSFSLPLMTNVGVRYIINLKK